MKTTYIATSASGEWVVKADSAEEAGRYAKMLRGEVLRVQVPR